MIPVTEVFNFISEIVISHDYCVIENFIPGFSLCFVEASCLLEHPEKHQHDRNH
jgi:hypothetical protein